MNKTKLKHILLNNKWLIAILVLASILRFYHLDFQSIWLDEIYTMKMTDPNQGISLQIHEINEKEGFPYLYFFILKILHSIFGYTPLVARLFSAIFGVLSILSIYKLGQTLYNKKVGLVAGTIVCFSEYCIFTSQDARPYSFYFFSVILSFYYLVKFLRTNDLKNAIVYGLATGLLLNTNFFSLVNVFSQYLIILIILFFSDKQNKILLFKYSFIAGMIALLMFVPNFQIFLKLLSFESGWIPAPTSESLTVIFKELLGGSEATVFIIMPLFFYYVFDVFNIENETTAEHIINNKKLFSSIILGIWSVSIVAIIYFKSYSDTSIMISRYFVSILPVFITVISIGIYLIKNTIIKTLVLTTLCFFMITNLVLVKKYYTNPIKTQFREAATYVLENNKTNEITYTSLKYFFDYFFNIETKNMLQERESLEVLLNEMQNDSTKIKSFWYVDAHNRPFKLSENGTAFAEKCFFIDKSYDGLDSWAKHFSIKNNSLKTVPIENTNNSETKSWIENFEFATNEINIKGWAFIKGIDANQSKIDIVLLKNNTLTAINTRNMIRNDITLSEKEGLNLDNSGFIAKATLKKLEKGNYKIGIRIENKDKNLYALIITEKNIDIVN